MTLHINGALYMYVAWGRVKKLSVSANDTKTGKQNVFSEIDTIYAFGTP
jgi:hypothetical protein